MSELDKFEDKMIKAIVGIYVGYVLVVLGVLGFVIVKILQHFGIL